MSPALPQADRGVVAYIHHTFPSRTATFVYREMAAVRDAGVEMLNIACKRPEPDAVHAEARKYVAETVYLPGTAHPLLYVRAMGSFLRHPALFTRLARQVLGAAGRGRLSRAFGEVVRGGCLAAELRRRPRVSHVHAPFSTEVATIAWMAAQLEKRRFSFTSHTAFDADLIAEKVRLAQFAVSISGFDRERLVEAAGASDRDKIHVIHCGVDGAGAAERREQEDPPILLCVGSLIEKKGHEVLLRACALLKERGMKFECRIAGDGPLKPALAAQARSLGIEGCTVFAGACDQETVRSLYEQARVFALPSVYASNGDLDGIPVVLMEAMAAGVPCVSTQVSGIPELIESPKEGLLVEEKNPAALADALEKLLRDRALREDIALAAREKVRREFNVRRSAAELSELFRQSIEMEGRASSRPSRMGTAATTKRGPPS